MKTTGHLQILYGNLAEGGSVAKISGKEGERFEGTARVFEGEKDLIEGLQSGQVHAGDVVVIRGIGPERCSRNAGNAKTYRRYYRRWFRKISGIDNRWKIQRRHAWFCGRSYNT